MITNLEITPMEKKGRGRPKKEPINYIPPVIDFGGLDKLKNLDIDPRMLGSMKSNMVFDELISFEGGVPFATNIMAGGGPGVGKTTILLDLIASVQNWDRALKVLFVSAEMGKKQMFKYTQRFPQFGNIQTLFTSDYLSYNTKDVIEQVLNQGYDLVLIDSIAEVVEGVRDDNKWDRKTAESWLVETLVNNNVGKNKTNKFTSFLLIQQFTKGEEFVGSNRLKHLIDATIKFVREDELTSLSFGKNRNGEVGLKLDYNLMSNKIIYGTVSRASESSDDDEDDKEE